ncbi:Uncharacterised protein [Mycolicibacterium gilvum]|uniref:Uncharacterized protein n=1 Tax=Mycolicibacterium gilvum TaxID=1804 RepID=A0A378SSJ4_9MYCO|nr:Uncharacterised protein [Mycolicibacterium gilvum]
MTWWNETGAWGGCLIVVVMLLAFWGIVVAELGKTRSQPHQDTDAPEVQCTPRAAETAGLLGGRTTRPPRRR